MGNKETTSQPLVLANTYSWETIQKNGAYAIVRCNNTGLTGQMYRVNMDQWKEEVQKYQFRKDNDQYLVGVYSVAKNKSQFICSTTQTINVVTERMPYVLTDFGKLSYEEALYVLLQVVSGMKLIYEADKMITFDQNLVFINQKGEAKIWINQNLGLNISQNRQEINEQNLIALIFKTIQNRIESHSIPQQYFHIKNQVAPRNFSSAQFFTKRIKFQHAPQVNKLVLPGNRKIKQVSKPNEILSNLSETQSTQFLLPNSQVSEGFVEHCQDNNKTSFEKNNRIMSEQTQNTQAKQISQNKLPPLPRSRAKSIGKSREKSNLIIQNNEQQPNQYIIQGSKVPILLNSCEPLPRQNSQRSLSNSGVYDNRRSRVIQVSQVPNLSNQARPLLLNSQQRSLSNSRVQSNKGSRIIEVVQVSFPSSNLQRSLSNSRVQNNRGSRIIRTEAPVILTSTQPLIGQNSQRSLSRSKVQNVNSPRIVRVIQQPTIIPSLPILNPMNINRHQIGSENIPLMQTNQGFKVSPNYNNQVISRRVINSRQKSFEKPNRNRLGSIQKATEAYPVSQKIIFNQQPNYSKAPKISFTYS